MDDDIALYDSLTAAIGRASLEECQAEEEIQLLQERQEELAKRRQNLNAQRSDVLRRLRTAHREAMRPALGAKAGGCWVEKRG